MKKRIAALLLALSMMTSTVLAVSDSYENFVRSGTYDGQFPDVAVTSPFYDNVAALYEYGLTVGRADGTFGPEAPVTVGQVVIFAGRLRSLYATGAPEEGAAAFPSESGTVYELSGISSPWASWGRSWTAGTATPPPGKRRPTSWPTPCRRTRCRTSTARWWSRPMPPGISSPM